MALLQRFSLIVLLFTLVACGGGSDGSFTGTDTDSDSGSELIAEGEIFVAVSLSNVNVTEQSPITVTATVTIGGEPYANQLVTFTVNNPDLGTFTPGVGTAISNAEGIASIVLNAGEVAGAGEITVTVTDAEFDPTIPFSSQGVSDVVVQIGSGSPFVEGIAELGQIQISAGATTSISIDLVDESGELYQEAVDVNFTSVCAEEEVPSAEIDSVITTSTGQAEANYLAKGCVGDDIITATAIVNGVSLQAQATLNVLPADVGSISFVSSSPETIGIVGTGAVGGSESSTLIFQVLDTNGNPVNNQAVDFSLSTDTGGIVINPSQAETNSQGFVQTVVNSGSVATSVRVSAVVVDSAPTIASQSSVLVISTGIPDQDSFSLSFSNFNPRAWGVDNVEVQVTALLADAFNNPAPDGTAVSFTTEGGSIEPSCVTTNGQCTVNWRSQNPRPEGEELSPNRVPPRETNIDEFGRPNFMGQKYGGRVTVLATAIGEESFPDLNGNGRFDVCEVPAFTGSTGKPCNTDGSFDTTKDDINYDGRDVSGRLYDRKEAFVDHNEDGLFNPIEDIVNEQAGGDIETYVEFNGDGAFNQKDGLYNGVLCAENNADGCSQTQKSINISAQGVIVMSGSEPHWCIQSATDGRGPDPTSEDDYTLIAGSHSDNNHLNFCEIKETSYPITIDDNGTGNDTSDDTITTINAQDVDFDDHLLVSLEGTASFTIVMADLHNQPMPSGSTISFEADIGSIVSGSSDWANTNKNGGEVFGATFKAGNEPESGNIYFTITYPDGGTLTVPILRAIVE